MKSFSNGMLFMGNSVHRYTVVTINCPLQTHMHCYNTDMMAGGVSAHVCTSLICTN